MGKVDRRGYIRDREGNLKSRNIARKRIFNKYPEYFTNPFTKENYVVHHINTNKKDNRPVNLFICTWEEHSRIHNYQKANRRKFKTKKSLIDFLNTSSLEYAGTSTNTTPTREMYEGEIWFSVFKFIGLVFLNIFLASAFIVVLGYIFPYLQSSLANDLNKKLLVAFTIFYWVVVVILYNKSKK